MSGATNEPLAAGSKFSLSSKGSDLGCRQHNVPQASWAWNAPLLQPYPPASTTSRPVTPSLLHRALGAELYQELSVRSALSLRASHTPLPDPRDPGPSCPPSTSDCVCELG